MIGGSGSMSAHTAAAASSPCSQRLGEHDGDRLADEADPIVGERRPGEVGVDLDEAVVRRDAEVGGGPHGDDAGHRRRRRSTWIDADRAVGDLGADEHGVQRSLERQVGEVPCAAPVSSRGSSVRSTRVPRIEPPGWEEAESAEGEGIDVEPTGRSHDRPSRNRRSLGT